VFGPLLWRDGDHGRWVLELLAEMAKEEPARVLKLYLRRQLMQRHKAHADLPALSAVLVSTGICRRLA